MWQQCGGQHAMAQDRSLFGLLEAHDNTCTDRDRKEGSLVRSLEVGSYLRQASVSNTSAERPEAEEANGELAARVESQGEPQQAGHVLLRESAHGPDAVGAAHGEVRSLAATALVLADIRRRNGCDGLAARRCSAQGSGQRVTVAHLLKKHRDSRRPASWRCGGCTCVLAIVMAR